MGTLIKSVKVIDPQSSFNGKTVDIFIEDGEIQAIGKNLDKKGATLLEGEAWCVSPGWFDLQVNLCDPGFELREDIQSGVKAAAAGGFTAIGAYPNTQPPIHSKTEVEYIINKAKSLKRNAVDVYPVGTVSHHQQGNDLAELYDMSRSGAIAFTDGKRTASDAGLLLRALLYVRNFNGIVIAHCNDKSIAAGGKMNEGATSTLLGLKGIPALAEEVMVARNIRIAEYAEARIHLASISTAGSVELVRVAKRKGIAVTASVNSLNLVFTDEALMGFDTNFKLDPPLRTKKDVLALIEGVKDGTIDCITSDHTPVDVENKVVEFDNAESGNSSIETTYASVTTNWGEIITPEIWVQQVAINSRVLVNLPVPQIKEGTKANLTLFEPNKQWTLEAKVLKSKSHNTPFIGVNFKGRVVGIFNKNTYIPA